MGGDPKTDGKQPLSAESKELLTRLGDPKGWNAATLAEWRPKLAKHPRRRRIAVELVALAKRLRDADAEKPAQWLCELVASAVSGMTAATRAVDTQAGGKAEGARFLDDLSGAKKAPAPTGTGLTRPRHNTQRTKVSLRPRRGPPKT